MNEISTMSVARWIDNHLSRGKNSFSLNEVRKAFPNDSEAALKLKLTRLSKKGKIISIHKGFYLIISHQYAVRGILPPALFIDGLMKFIEKPYYVGLLNAAAFHGAAHQQPQEFYVFTDFPVLRPTKKKGIKINYISKKDIPQSLLEKRKTETGYLTISSPELTAADLVQFEKRIGGLNRAATVLNELSEVIKPDEIKENFFKEIPVTIVQRLGYLLDKVLDHKTIADYLFEQSQKINLNFFRIPLKTSSRTKGFSSDDKWKVIVNTEIEIDE
jgi:predicted transcriptional regulator of viral defense system